MESDKKKYDYLIVGAGLFGATFAHEMTASGCRCLVIEKRNHIGGNAFTEEIDGITVHRYGAHIFHTRNRAVWEYVNRLVPFNRFVNAPIAVYRDEVYNLPFNMNTFARMWGIRTPDEARGKIAEQVKQAGIGEARNLEQQAVRMVGEDVYRKLVKEYTEKQWGRPCSELPPFIIKRLPVRFTYDNNYFDDPYQGIPEGGYTAMVEKLLANSEVRLGCDFLENKEAWRDSAHKVLYTGALDRLFDYRLGALGYRSLRFETERLPTENYQGNAVVNFTSHDVPYTRIIEHKHFAFGTQPTTVITREYPVAWRVGDEPYYPINNEDNDALAARYIALARCEGYLLGGRLADYRYYDMDAVIARALSLAETERTVAVK